MNTNSKRAELKSYIEELQLDPETKTELIKGLHQAVEEAKGMGFKQGSEYIDQAIQEISDQEYEIPGKNYITYLLNRQMRKFSAAEALGFAAVFGGIGGLLYLAFFYSY